MKIGFNGLNRCIDFGPIGLIGPLTCWLVDFAHRARVCVKFTVLRRMEGRDTVAECFELLFNGVIRVIKLDVKRETLTPYDKA